MEPVRIGLLAISGWLVAAVLTVGISWSAISVVRSSVVAQPSVGLPAPAETPTGPPTTAAPTSRPTSTATAGQVALASGQGGSAAFRCVNGRPTFVNSTPNSGFTAAPDDSGAEVQFRSSDHRTQITATCIGSTAHTQVEERASGGGGGGGDDNGGGGGGSGRGRGGGGDG
jgi:hypothetical protein